jgi:exonuclease III
MIVLSYNVRGLGGGEKRAEVRQLVREKHPLVVCIQESKLSVVDDLLIKSIWGDAPSEYSYQPSLGASGGLITVWDSSRVVVWSCMSFGHVLVVKGKVIQTAEEFILFNVYAPCDAVSKRALWERLVPLIINNQDVCLCVCGDFNSVRSIDEKKGRGTTFRQVDVDAFNNFIAGSLLIDLPICGQLFTWYRGDGVSMSRLDRFLLSEKWCEAWPNCIQVAYQRGLSDHVPLMLSVDEAN